MFTRAWEQNARSQQHAYCQVDVKLPAVHAAAAPPPPQEAGAAGAAGCRLRRQRSAPPPAGSDNPWRKRTRWNISGCIVYALFLAARPRAPGRELPCNLCGGSLGSHVEQGAQTCSACAPWCVRGRWPRQERARAARGSQGGSPNPCPSAQAYCFYFYVRITYTLNTGIYWYSIAVLAFEFTASSSMIVHGLGLLRVRDMRGRAAVRAAGPAPLAFLLAVTRARLRRSTSTWQLSSHGPPTLACVVHQTRASSLSWACASDSAKRSAQRLAWHASRNAGRAAPRRATPCRVRGGPGRHAAVPRVQHPRADPVLHGEPGHRGDGRAGGRGRAAAWQVPAHRVPAGRRQGPGQGGLGGRAGAAFGRKCAPHCALLQAVWRSGL